MEFPIHFFSYHGNSGEVGCYVASRPLTKDSNYFEVGRAGGEVIKLQRLFLLDSPSGPFISHQGCPVGWGKGAE